MALLKYQAPKTDPAWREAVKSRMIFVPREDKKQQAGKPHQCKVKFSPHSCWQFGASRKRGKPRSLHFPQPPALTGFRRKAWITWESWNLHMGPVRVPQGLGQADGCCHVDIRTCPRYRHCSPAQGQPGERGWPRGWPRKELR